MIQNQVTNPSADVDLTNWAASAGTGGTATLSRLGPFSIGSGIPDNHQYVIRATWSVAATAGTPGVSVSQVPVLPGQIISGGMWVRSSGQRNCQVAAIFTDSTGALISSTSSAAVPLYGNGIWQIVKIENVTVPANAAFMSLLAYMPTAPATATLDAVVGTVIPTDHLPQPFDGDSIASGYDSYGWVGTPGVSVSQHNTAAMPAIDVRTDWNPTPRIGITFTELPFDTETATVYRVSDDGLPTIVPGGENIGALGGLTLIDSYAPLGVVTQYQAETFDGNGNSLGLTPLNSGLIPIYDVTIIQSPSDPSIYATVDMQEDAASDLYNPADSTTYNLGNGRRIAISEQTQLLSDVEMGFFTDTLSSYSDALAVAKNDSGQIVYRTPPPMLIPRVFYTLGQPHRQEFNRPAGLEDVEWTNKVDEISPPASNIVAPAVTYSPYVNTFATYAAFQAAYGSYLDAERNPPAVTS